MNKQQLEEMLEKVFSEMRKDDVKQILRYFYDEGFEPFCNSVVKVLEQIDTGFNDATYNQAESIAKECGVEFIYDVDCTTAQTPSGFTDCYNKKALMSDKLTVIQNAIKHIKMDYERKSHLIITNCSNAMNKINRLRGEEND